MVYNISFMILLLAHLHKSHNVGGPVLFCSLLSAVVCRRL